MLPLFFYLHYPFNGNANDESGNGNDGTVYGSTLTDDRFGNANSAYDFDGVDDYIQLPANTYFTGDFTFSGWVYLESYNNLCVYYDFGNGNGNNTVRSIPVDQTTPSYHMQIFENYNGENLFCDEYIILNSWKHLVNVLNGNQLSFYIDGNFINTVTTNYIPLNVIRSINYFAKSSYSGASYTNAIYDDIRIYNRVLSPQEIDSLYHEGGWDDFICDFSASPISGNAPLNVNFTDQSIGNPTIWKWDFENDGVYDSYIQNPSHIYSDTGTYSVKLVIENGTEIDSIIKYDYITVYTSANDLVAYYPFNGNANDESGNCNHGTVIGSDLTNDRFGNTNSAYYFNGTGDYINVINSSTLNFGADTNFTINVWLNTDCFSSLQGLVEKAGDDGSGEGGWQVMLSNGKVYSEFGNGTLGGPFYGNDSLNLNTWYMVTYVVYRNSTIAYHYVNGNIDQYHVSPAFQDNISSTVALRIGAERTLNPGYCFEGEIDDISIYNRALSQQEIDSLYHEGGWDEIVCDFSASPLYGNQPLNVNFTDQSLGNPTIWKWDFENDGVFDAFIQNSSHTYNQEGSYSVKLVVENSTDSDTLIKFNYITVTSGSGSIGLIAYYPFNGNADDESGNGHHGIVHGATVTVNRFGTPSSAYDFDGINDYISSIIGNYDTVSVSFWYKAPYPDKWYPTFFSYFQTGFLGQYGGTLSPPYITGDVLCYPANSGLQNLPIPAFNEWHHVYMDIDNIGNTQMVYVDGLYDSTYIGVPGISPGNDFHMGVGDPAGNPLQFFTGSLDDFRIYDIRLSEDEIIELYQESEIETPSICIVSVDDITNENLVVWEKQITTEIDSFRIYRESTQANVFEYIGSVAYEDSSLFLDETSIPVQRAYKYKISSLGTTGEESLLSNYHKTIHLTISPGPYGMNLNWDQYEGFEFGTYYIYKGNNTNNFVLIDSISSNFTSYADIYPPWGNMYYLIEIINPNGCFPSKNSDYSRSRSNVVFNPQVSIAESNNENFLIYPVPSHDYVIISSDNDIKENVKIRLLDLNGRVLFEEKMNLDKIILNLTSVKPGIYLINIVGNDINIIRKIVKY